MNITGIEHLPEFDDHRLITFVFDAETGLRGFIAIHRGNGKAPALGATRLWPYENEIDSLRDALRLSRLMSYKSALAGLKYGGAKATLIASPKALQNRRGLFESYAHKVDDLGGRFITGTDVGVTDDDVRLMRKITPYVIGSHLDPAYYTAAGVLYGIQESLKFLTGDDAITGKKFAIQGVGKTGLRLLELIKNHAAEIYIADVNKDAIGKAKEIFSRARVVSPLQIHKQKVDVFVPAALGGVLNAQNVSELQCRIVCGSANNQLANSFVGDLLTKLGIIYAPDYVVNAGGLIGVADEFENKQPNKKRILRSLVKIRKTLRKIFNQAEKTKKSTGTIADEMAQTVFNQH